MRAAATIFHNDLKQQAQLRLIPRTKTWDKDVFPLGS